MVDFSLSDEERQIRDTVRSFIGEVGKGFELAMSWIRQGRNLLKGHVRLGGIGE
jgi:predicted nuclease of restriction endonuclease-like (RecB) superfamily